MFGLGSGKTFIVEEGPSPSTDYFVLPFVKQTSTQIIRCSWRELPSPAELAHATVIFVRYVPRLWRQLVTTHRQQLRCLVYFMDDDLFDFSASRGLSWRYRYKLLRHATQARNWLDAMQAVLWVSSDWLVNKYASNTPTLLVPRPLGCLSAITGADADVGVGAGATVGASTDLDTQANVNNTRRVFYHGSASHADEIVWLYPIIKEVLKQHAKVTFEIIGTKKVNQLYRNLPRVTVVHPMTWPNYQQFIQTSGRHIGLAPSLNTPFNRARSYTKFFDITAAGAVGIYAQSGPAQKVLTHRAQGLLVNMTQSAWIDAISQLVQHDLTRQHMLVQAKALAHSLAAATSEVNP